MTIFAMHKRTFTRAAGVSPPCKPSKSAGDFFQRSSFGVAFFVSGSRQSLGSPGGRSELTAAYLAVKRISKRLVLASPGGRSELTASCLAVKRMSERLVLASPCRMAEVGVSNLTAAVCQKRIRAGDAALSCRN
jgi:hypothetical protein